MSADGKPPRLPGWRPGPPRPELAPGFWKSRRARPVDEVLRGLPGMADDLLLARIDSVWEELVGREIAGLAKVEELRAGELLVKVAHPVWLAELNALAEEIRGRLHERLADEGTDTRAAVRRLRFITGA